MEIIATNNSSQNNSDNLINLLRSAGSVHPSLGFLTEISGFFLYFFMSMYNFIIIIF